MNPLSRNTCQYIDAHALMHNLMLIKHTAPHSKVLAMVKANAYGCGIKQIIPILEGQVEAFGVTSVDEAMAIRKLGSQTPCVIMQGVFDPAEWSLAATQHFIYVIHSTTQLKSLLNTPLPQPISVWIKFNTGMNRLGIQTHEAHDVIHALSACPWVKSPLTFMMHFANAPTQTHGLNAQQIKTFHLITAPYPTAQKSLANSAAIFTLPSSHADWIRPGISLYGISPFEHLTGIELGLKPVMHFTSYLMHTYMIETGQSVGYGSTWIAKRPSLLGVIPVGYGDGYPRTVKPFTPVWINGQIAPIVGIISMDSMMVDLTDLPKIPINTPVELWGKHLPIEQIAKAANTIPYELLCKVLSRHF